ncbi:MAG: YhbY family RNA-binding protein [Blastochloris sp.]|nr:YhbY family RNA-binding protein [Blastochloris sp.]
MAGNSSHLSALKARAQLLNPLLRVGKAGLSEAFLKQMESAFLHHDLIKIKFDSHQEEIKRLAPELAEKTNSQLIHRVGHTATYHRPGPAQAS